ncbi:MAG: sugar phosphate nucleotidyltransferase [Candidatus Hydrogenedentes bacterium]|nr:sugar phosphate nucleotidyltransferase [Candidatus Hydrogenedentota bacterium]
MISVILCAGKSTRTYPLTVTRPKPLLPVVNKPIIEYQLSALSSFTDKFILVVGYRREMIMKRLGNVWNGVKIEYIVQEEQKGTGHAVLLCEEQVKGRFIVVNGDDLFSPEDLKRLSQQMRPTALVKEVEDPRSYGIYEIDSDGKVRRLVEKPKTVFSHLANIGAYLFTPEIFPAIRNTSLSERGEIEITSAIQGLAEQSGFWVIYAEDYWLPIGYPWDLLKANAFLLDRMTGTKILGKLCEGVHIEGNVFIDEDTIVKPGVVIEGPVYIGKNCTIGPNCWIRPYTTIGNQCRVGQASEIKNSILFDGAYAPHQNYVGDSILGEGVNLGCGTVTANVRHDGQTHKSVVNGVLIDTGLKKLGAIIGDSVHTGILTAIYPGRKMWPNTFTRPGEIVDRDIIGEEFENEAKE